MKKTIQRKKMIADYWVVVASFVPNHWHPLHLKRHCLVLALVVGVVLVMVVVVVVMVVVAWCCKGKVMGLQLVLLQVLGLWVLLLLLLWIQ